MSVKEYLKSVIDSNHPNRIKEETFNEYHEVRQEIAEALREEFPVGKEMITDPFNSGSWAKKTAVNTRFDLDLAAVFKFRDSQNGPKGIKRDVFNAMKEHFGGRNGFEVRDQRVSTGIKAKVNGKLVEVDVVAGMETGAGAFNPSDQDKNHEGKFLMLFDRESKGNGKIKTNIHRQIHKVKRDMEPWHDGIRLLKTWKKENDGPISSYALEMLTYATLKKGFKPGGPDETLRAILEHGIDVLPDLDLIDIGTGKAWPDFLNSNQKSELRKSFQELLKALDKQKPDLDQLKILFPENKPFVKPKPSRNRRYGSSSYA